MNTHEINMEIKRFMTALETMKRKLLLSFCHSKLLPVLGDDDEHELSAFLILYLRRAEEASQEIISALHK